MNNVNNMSIENPSDYIRQQNGIFETTNELDTACAIVIDALGQVKSMFKM